MNVRANNNAFATLQKAPEFPRITRKDFFGHLFQMQRDGLITEADYMGPSRHTHKSIELTDAGRMRIAYQAD